MSHNRHTFEDFQNTNRRRCEEGFGHPVAWDESSWPLENWALAVSARIQWPQDERIDALETRVAE